MTWPEALVLTVQLVFIGACALVGTVLYVRILRRYDREYERGPIVVGTVVGFALGILAMVLGWVPSPW